MRGRGSPSEDEANRGSGLRASPGVNVAGVARTMCSGPSRPPPTRPGRRAAREAAAPPDKPRTGPEAMMDVEVGPSGGENVVRRIIATSEDGDAVVEMISESGRKHVYQYRHLGEVRAEAYSLRALVESIAILGVHDEST